MNKQDKQYGLIIPKKSQLSAPRAINVFGDDDDSDKEDGMDWVKKALKAEGEKNRIKKQTKLNMQKALEEDPTIYQYDEIYDDMEISKQQDKVAEMKVAKKPKYIHNLLKAAERRKREQEHRIERMVQKERDAEGEMYADKESFVTSAYRAKLEEFKKMEEEEAKMDRLEAIGDVTKQPDISGFYRQLYTQTVVVKKMTENEADDKKYNFYVSDDGNVDKDDKILSKDSASSSEYSESEVEETVQKNRKRTDKKKINLKSKGVRQYRKRNVELSNSESEHENENQSNDDNNDIVDDNDNDDMHNHDNFVKQDDDDDDDNDDDDGEVKLLKKKAKLSEKNDTIDDDDSKEKISQRENCENFKVPDQNTFVNKAKAEEDEEKQKKISIWEKRMIGPVFEAALQRYYSRKAMRSSES